MILHGKLDSPFGKHDENSTFSVNSESLLIHPSTDSYNNQLKVEFTNAKPICISNQKVHDLSEDEDSDGHIGFRKNPNNYQLEQDAILNGLKANDMVRIFNEIEKKQPKPAIDLSQRDNGEDAAVDEFMRF